MQTKIPHVQTVIRSVSKVRSQDVKSHSSFCQFVTSLRFTGNCDHTSRIRHALDADAVLVVKTFIRKDGSRGVGLRQATGAVGREAGPEEGLTASRKRISKARRVNETPPALLAQIAWLSSLP